MKPHYKRLLIALRFALVAVALFIIWRLFGNIDWAKTYSLISNLRFALPLVLLPYLLVTGFDTLGWKRVLPNVDRNVPFLRLMGIRLSTEAVLLSVPVGTAFAESLKPFLLKKRCGVPYAEGVASVVAKKCLLGIAQSLYMLIGALLGFWMLSAGSAAFPGLQGFPWIVLTVSFVMLGIWGLASTSFLYGSVAQRLHRMLVSIPLRGRRPIHPLQTWLQKRREHFVEADEHLTKFTGSRKHTTASAIVMFMGGWMMEAVETYLILSLLGANVSFVQVMLFEPSLSLLRALAFFMPAGLGVLDLGYVTFFQACGIADYLTLGAAFLIIKRTKELFWIAVGYSLLFLMRNRPNEMLVQTA